MAGCARGQPGAGALGVSPRQRLVPDEHREVRVALASLEIHFHPGPEVDRVALAQHVGDAAVPDGHLDAAGHDDSELVERELEAVLSRVREGTCSAPAVWRPVQDRLLAAELRNVPPLDGLHRPVDQGVPRRFRSARRCCRSDRPTGSSAQDSNDSQQPAGAIH